jgi:hypothetical protein
MAFQPILNSFFLWFFPFLGSGLFLILIRQSNRKDKDIDDRDAGWKNLTGLPFYEVVGFLTVYWWSELICKKIFHLENGLSIGIAIILEIATILVIRSRLTKGILGKFYRKVSVG